MLPIEDNSTPVQFLAPHYRLRWHLGTVLLTAAISSGLARLTGINLGLFLGGLVLCAMLAPYAAALWDRPRHGLIAAACVAHVIAANWLWAVWADPAVHLRSWLGMYGVMIGVVLLEASLVAVLHRAGLRSTSAAGLTVILGLLWLTAPIWLFPHLQTPGLLSWMQRLINIHPVFAINSAAPLSIWPEMPIAYTLMNLNQDVPYTLPTNPIAAILAHGAVAALLCLIWIKEPRQSGR